MKILFHLGKKHTLEALRQPAEEVGEIDEILKDVRGPCFGWLERLGHDFLDHRFHGFDSLDETGGGA